MREDVKREIIRLIDENRSPWVKAAFYSDPEVSSILDRLIESWESNNRNGIPLDYASDQELETLYRLAKKYSSLSDDEARAYVWGSREPGKGGSLLDLLRRIVRRP